MKTYSVKEASKLIGITERSIQIKCKKDNIRKKDNKYLITEKHINDWQTKSNETKSNEVSQTTNEQIKKLQKELQELKEENKILKQQLKEDVPHQEKLKQAIQLITLEAMEQNVQHKIFTEEEYNDIIGTISEVDFQKEQVQYLRNRIEKQDDMLLKLSESLEDSLKEKLQRNFIEAKEKGFDE